MLLPACPLVTCSNIETKIHVSVCRGVWVYSPTCVHVKAKSRHPASSSTALPRFFLKQLLLLNFEVILAVRLTGQDPSGIHLSLWCPQPWGYRCLPPSRAFYMDAGERNLGPRACKASTSRAEPCPNMYYFLCWQMQQAVSHPCRCFCHSYG